MKKVAICSLLALAGLTYGKFTPPGPEYFAPNYEVPEGLVEGAQFQDRFLPVPIQSPLRSDVWGAEGVVPRDITNGMEHPDWSYWGGNMVTGTDGKEHLFLCRWPENHKRGHRAWGESVVVHAVADSPMGPFAVIDEIGPGHNPEIYQAKDGSWLIGVLENIGTYHAPTLNGPWKPHMPNFIHKKTKPYNMRNRAYAKCDDGSVLMVIKNGTIWHSEDGITDFRQVSEGSVYPKPKPGLKAYHEDPVMWKDEVQFHLVVNDCQRREAFYLRSKDGIHWKSEPGHAYRTDMMTYEDGTKERWYKWERPKVRLDQYGRATHMNFGVLDVPKGEDKCDDNHSSKNVVIPLLVPRRLEIIKTDDPTRVRVKVKAEPDFNPHKDLDLKSLYFGAAEEVNFGRGAAVVKSKKTGKDLILSFETKACGFTADNFAAKLIGKTASGELLLGWARLPQLKCADAMVAGNGGR